MIYDSAIDGSEIRLSCCGSGLRRDELEVRPRRISILIIGIKYYISSHLWGILSFAGTIIMPGVGDFWLKSSGDSIIFTSTYYDGNLLFAEFRFLSLS